MRTATLARRGPPESGQRGPLLLPGYGQPECRWVGPGRQGAPLSLVHFGGPCGGTHEWFYRLCLRARRSLPLRLRSRHDQPVPRRPFSGLLRVLETSSLVGDRPQRPLVRASGVGATAFAAVAPFFLLGPPTFTTAFPVGSDVSCRLCSPPPRCRAPHHPFTLSIDASSFRSRASSTTRRRARHRTARSSGTCSRSRPACARRPSGTSSAASTRCRAGTAGRWS